MPDMVRALTGLVGPPPRFREPPLQPPLAADQQEPPGAGALGPEEEEELMQQPAASPMTAAMLEQSRALSQLVSHLVSADGLSDASALGATPGLGLGVRGAAKRERLQQELASRSGTFLLQVAQQACRRLSPTLPVPQSLGEAHLAQPSLFTTYVERTGGYGSHRDTGLVMWIMANLSNALLAEDVKAASDLAAVCMVALEQSVLDVAARGPSGGDFCSSARLSGCEAESLQCLMPPGLGLHGHCLHQRSRHPGDTEVRADRCQGFSEGSRGRARPSTKGRKEALPQEAQGIPGLTPPRAGPGQGPSSANQELRERRRRLRMPMRAPTFLLPSLGSTSLRTLLL